MCRGKSSQLRRDHTLGKEKKKKKNHFSREGRGRSIVTKGIAEKPLRII